MLLRVHYTWLKRLLFAMRCACCVPMVFIGLSSLCHLCSTGVGTFELSVPSASSSCCIHIHIQAETQISRINCLLWGNRGSSRAPSLTCCLFNPSTCSFLHLSENAPGLPHSPPPPSPHAGAGGPCLSSDEVRIRKCMCGLSTVFFFRSSQRKSRNELALKFRPSAERRTLAISVDSKWCRWNSMEEVCKGNDDRHEQSLLPLERRVEAMRRTSNSYGG